MTERWFIVGTDSRGRFLLDPSSMDGQIMWNVIANSTRLAGLLHNKIASFRSRESARSALVVARKNGTQLAKSARIVRVRRWSKGERAKTACDRAGIQTLENGKPISTGRRVELLAERAMGLGATVHEQRAELYALRAEGGKPAVKPDRTQTSPLLGLCDAILGPRAKGKKARAKSTRRGNRS